MKTWLAIVLSLFLIVSLGINVYLWLSLKQHNDKAYALEASYEHRLDSDKQLETQAQLVDETQVNEKAEPFNNERSPANFSPMTGTKTAPNALDDLRTSSPLVNQEQLESLTTLLNNEQYALLATELTNLLKYDPLNESLLLLEGELIELTKPLSTDIVHYYDLAELPLSTETLSFIDAKIATLYQQAQTQLSQDEQWELVARLNEPLYQRIPDARHYTLNLAEAYAYQQKLTLM